LTGGKSVPLFSLIRRRREYAKRGQDMKASRLAVAALIASGVVLLGCSSNAKHTRQSLDDQQLRQYLDGMVGQSASDLVHDLGEPTRIEDDGHDGRVLIWEEDHYDGYFPGVVYPVAPGYRLWLLPPAPLGHTESLMFYAHEDGTIYGWHIQDS